MFSLYVTIKSMLYLKKNIISSLGDFENALILFLKNSLFYSFKFRFLLGFFTCILCDFFVEMNCSIIFRRFLSCCRPVLLNQNIIGVFITSCTNFSVTFLLTNKTLKITICLTNLHISVSTLYSYWSLFISLFDTLFTS